MEYEYGKTSTQVKETISFLEELSEIGAINGEVVPMASDIQKLRHLQMVMLQWHIH